MLITRSDYERIYRVINSLLINEGADPSVCCMYFSMYGAFLLEHNFKVKAVAYAGVASYHFGENRLLFGKVAADGYVSAEPDGFHCWIEADGWLIDFMAPAFGRLLPGQEAIPAKMLQKKLSLMADSPSSLQSSGDFFLGKDGRLTVELTQKMASVPMYGDLGDIAAMWFKKSPKKMAASVGVGGISTGLRAVALSGETLVGTW